MIKALAFIHKKTGLSDIDFRTYYENSHAPLASSLLTFEGYERNFIISKFNQSYESLGSISIFKYQSMKSLDVIGEQMESSKGDTLREDELKFMDVPKNFFILTESEDSINNMYEQKIFYPAKKIQELNALDNYSGLEKISENYVMGPHEIMGIAEYGVTNEISLSAMKAIAQDQTKVLFASSVS